MSEIYTGTDGEAYKAELYVIEKTETVAFETTYEDDEILSSTTSDHSAEAGDGPSETSTRV
jgi:hypothetical protein